jgi:hypothetical protein
MPMLEFKHLAAMTYEGLEAGGLIQIHPVDPAFSRDWGMNFVIHLPCRVHFIYLLTTERHLPPIIELSHESTAKLWEGTKAWAKSNAKPLYEQRMTFRQLSPKNLFNDNNNPKIPFCYYVTWNSLEVEIEIQPGHESVKISLQTQIFDLPSKPLLMYDVMRDGYRPLRQEDLDQLQRSVNILANFRMNVKNLSEDLTGEIRNAQQHYRAPQATGQIGSVRLPSTVERETGDSGAEASEPPVNGGCPDGTPSI